MTRRIVLLGPQRDLQTVGAAVARLGVRDPLAVVTAGWEEREAEDEELREHLGRPVAALGLWPRAEEVFHADPRVRTLLYERYDRLRALQELYRLRLAPELAACRELLARTDPARPDALHGPEIDHAIEGVRRLDAHHLERTRELDAEIFARIDAPHRRALARHRAQIARALEGAGALLIAGGHVGILLNRLRLFGVLELAPELPIVAWSGGAMALAERIVLFHDSPPQGAGDPEVYASGAGLVRGLIPLPHAGTRLLLDDRARVALFARRFAPDRCVTLDPGERLEGTGGGTEWAAFDGARTLGAGGQLIAGAAA